MTLTDTFRTPIGAFSTGCIPKAPDARDHLLERVPAVAEAMAQPLPQRVDHKSLIWEITNQGSEPSCVAFSTAYCLQGFEMAEAKARVSFDGHSAYLENGGDGRSGVPADRVLRKSRADGFPVVKSGLRFKISSYQWTDDLQVVLAALTAGRLCVVACLLPSNFWAISKGDGDSGVPTNVYHQMCVTGFQFDSMEFGSDGWIFGPNSWGRSFGMDGFYRLRMSYLMDRVKQQGYFYGYSLTDAPDGDSVPVPTPKPVPVPVPTPKPVAKVTGLFREQRSVVPISQIVGGNEFILTGEGFGEKGSVTWNAVTLQVAFWDATRIVCKAPESVGQPKLGSIRVKLANGVAVLGPSLTIL